MIGESVRLSARAIERSEESRIRGVATLARRRAVFVLRLSLAIVFLWFGLLKLAGVSPVVELLRSSMPLLARSPFIELLGLAEILISIGLISERFAGHAAFLMMLHLTCTLSIVLIAPGLMFDPAFPVLTMNGEFLAKNLVLIAAGLSVISSRRDRS
jgi:putative oxidoreductase